MPSHDFPSHASPALTPLTTPSPKRLPLDLSSLSIGPLHGEREVKDYVPYNEDLPPPPSLLSPAFTPPSTPGGSSTPTSRPPKVVSVDTAQDDGGQARPRLLERLPNVSCIARARIPTILKGQEMFLHLYQNDSDNKEHLAIVFGDRIRSRSLDAPREGETEQERMTRGAYTGRLFPGRTSSKAAHGVTTGSSAHRQLLGQALAGAARKHGQDAGHQQRQQQQQEQQSLPEEDAEHESAVHTDPTDDIPPLVRIHSECYTGETVWSARCDCGEQLDEAARLMSLPTVPPPTAASTDADTPTTLAAAASSSASSGPIPSTTSSSTPRHPTLPQPVASIPPSGGVIIYLRQEGRGIGLSEKLKAYNLQDLGADTVEANLLLRHPADARSYGLATAMLVDLGLGGDRGIRLLTNNPDKVRAVEGPNREITVKERVAMVPMAWRTGGAAGIKSKEVGDYMRTKIERMGHMLDLK